MTWDQFKTQIDEALAAAGKDGSIEIDYIDFSQYGRSLEIRPENNELVVYS